jgi:hypothetical protein
MRSRVQKPGGHFVVTVHLTCLIGCLLGKGPLYAEGEYRWRLEEIGDTLGLLLVCPPMAPYLEEDTFGMCLEVCILQ